MEEEKKNMTKDRERMKIKEEAAEVQLQPGRKRRKLTNRIGNEGND